MNLLNNLLILAHRFVDTTIENGICSIDATFWKNGRIIMVGGQNAEYAQKLREIDDEKWRKKWRCRIFYGFVMLIFGAFSLPLFY